MKSPALAHLVLAGLALAGGALPARAQAPETSVDITNDYPTEARADYVFACMAVNGGTREALHNCSCAIDVIASILPYHEYERADTVLRMRQLGGGYLASEFRVAGTNETLLALREAQAEAEVRCF
jgi:hypothetical protein